MAFNKIIEKGAGLAVGLAVGLVEGTKKGYNRIVGKKNLDGLPCKQIEKRNRIEELCNEGLQLEEEANKLLELLNGVEKTEAEALYWKNSFEWADTVRSKFEQDVGIRYCLQRILELYEFPPESCWGFPEKLRTAIFNTYGQTALRKFKELPTVPKELTLRISWEGHRETLRQMIAALEKQTVNEECEEDEIVVLLKDTLKKNDKIWADYGSVTAEHDRYKFMRGKDEWVKHAEELYGALETLLEGERFCKLDKKIEPVGNWQTVERFGEEQRLDEGTIAYLQILEEFCEGVGGLRVFLDTWPADALDHHD